MVRKNALLRKYIRIYKDNLSIEKMASKYEPLGADANTTDGLNVQGALRMKSTSGKPGTMGCDRDGHRLARAAADRGVTTAGMDRQSVCWEKHEYTCKVLEGCRMGRSWTIPGSDVFCIDEGDDWQDEQCWVKANPNWGFQNIGTTCA